MAKAELLIKDLKSRAGINVAQAILRAAKLPTARSWTELEAIIVQAVNKNPAIYDALVAALRVQLVCDMKATSYFSIEPEKKLAVKEALLAAKIEETNFSKAFPLSVPVEELQSDDGVLKAIHSFSDDFGVGVIFSRKRVFSISEEYSHEKFTESMLEQFPHHDKIIAIKNYYHQTFDVVYLNFEYSVLELRADITRSDSLLQTVKQQEKSCTDLRNLTQLFLLNSLKEKVIGAPRNLFPLIKKIYTDPSGAIKKLGFSTVTGSIKTETMKGGVDLRQEPFHLNGAKAINHEMTLYEVAIIWHRIDIDSVNSKPELYVPGTHMNSVSLEPRCDFAILKGIRSNCDTNFVLKKMASFEK
ncbi:hypothetical protein [Pseudomonas rhodesiae]|uniref:hypothetical protein n=1 Tax=Pseudomonas rhodesiae TaxID=76760 RepID=UPI0028ABECA3|nr:hypothetical protein [Pseudomonas rhodesiae]